MILYLDTSALVKLYFREEGSTEVRSASRHAEVTATSVVAYAECRAGFARRLREGLTNGSLHERRVTRLNRDWERYMRIDAGPEIVRHAGELAEQHALRGFDAIHLASALWLAGRAPAPVVCLAYDHRLLNAAAKAGLETVY